MKRILLLTGAGLLMLAISLAGVAFPEEQTKEKAPPPSERGQKTVESGKDMEKQKNMVIARVNQTGITMNKLIEEMNMIAPQFIQDPGQRTPEIDKKIKETALNILIFRELAVQEAVRQGIKIRPDAIAAEKDRLRTKLGSEERYRKYLEKTGHTEESLSRQIEREKLFEAIVAKEVFRKVKTIDQATVEKRKGQWEKGLKKKAKVEILLPKIEEQIIEDLHKGK